MPVFTYTSKKKQLEILIPAGIQSATGKKEIIKCISLWDTGATRSSITKKIATILGLTPVGFGNVNHAGGTSKNVPFYAVNILLPERVRIENVPVLELQGDHKFDLIVGMDIITLGDFSLTRYKYGSQMSYRIPSTNEGFSYKENKQELIKSPSQEQLEKRKQERKNLYKLKRKNPSKKK